MALADIKQQNYERAAAAVPNGRRRFDRILTAVPTSTMVASSSPSPSPNRKSLTNRLLSAHDNKFEQAQILIDTAKNKPWELKTLDKNRRIDLRGADLSGLKNDVKFLPFGRVDLTNANLSGAQLQGADMRNAMLPGATLAGANMDGAKLDYAVLDRANMDGSVIAGAGMKGTNANEANLNGAKARNVGMDNTALNGAKLAAADLTGASLNHTSMIGILGRGIVLNGASGNETNLTGAQIPDAQIKNAHFDKMAISGDLTGANMNGTVLNNPKGDLKALDQTAQKPRITYANTGIVTAPVRPMMAAMKPWAGMIVAPGFV